MLTRRFTFAAVLGLALTGCHILDPLDDARENPNAPTTVAPELLFAESMLDGVDAAYDRNPMLYYTSVWSRHVAQFATREAVGGVLPARMQEIWDELYAGPLVDIQRVVESTRDADRPALEGAARIWRVWLFHIVTDLWGDVPYSEALQGAEQARPAYDRQEDIYADLLAELESAVALIEGAPAGAPGFTPPGADLLLGGDLDAWVRFANALRMRLAMRLVEVDAPTAQSAFVDAWNAGPLASNADNVMFSWPGAPYENPLYQDYVDRDDHALSETLVDSLQSLADPRLELYAEPAVSDGMYRGFESGSAAVADGSTLSRIGNFWRADGATTPSLLMSYSEVLLLGAEAAERGWITDDAGTLYVDGITANMEQYAGMATNAPTPGEITTYLGQGVIAYAGGATGLDQIHLQQWIGLYLQGPEAFAHWRRTGIPVLTPGPDEQFGTIPVRFAYPDNEQSVNGENYQQAVDRQGVDNVTTPVWWDAN